MGATESPPKTRAKWIVLKCDNPLCSARGTRWPQHSTDHRREGWCPECTYPGVRVSVKDDTKGEYRAPAEHVSEGGEFPDL